MNFQAKLIIQSQPLSLPLGELEKWLPQEARIPLTQSNPDILIVQPHKNSIGIDEMHKLIEWVAQKPFQHTHKLGIVYAADLLTPEAQNSLLKTLEEPAPDTSIILISESEQSILPTIRSRCQVIYASGSTTADTEYAQLAGAFISASYLDRLDMIAKIEKRFADDRAGQKQIITQIMHQLVAKHHTIPDPKLAATLEICKTALVAIQSSVNMRLTWETLAITIEV